MLRLVRDDDVQDAIAVNTLPPDTNEFDEANAAEEAALQQAAARTRRKRKTAVTELAEPGSDAVEPIDGPVADTSNENATEEGDESAADTLVDTGLLEALLFSTHHPLTAARLAELMELPTPGPVRKAIKALTASYEQSGRSFRIEQVAGGYQMLTLPEYGEHLKRLVQKEIDSRLSRAAVETLAIIAYKQPILRAEVEAIRGVACGETIRSLMEKHLVRIAGRAEEPGRPILYGTTKRFLELFGLNSLKDLPQGEELLVPK